jgi:hypothetical protein
MIRFVLAATVAAVVAAASPARAEEAKRIQLSLFEPVQLVPAAKSVSGLSLALLYSKNANVTGLDWSGRGPDDREPEGRRGRAGRARRWERHREGRLAARLRPRNGNFG